MKAIAFCTFWITVLLLSCSSEPERKLYIKSVKISESRRIDWYVHSSIGNFSPDYLQIGDDREKTFFKTFFLSDIQFRNDSFLISLWKLDYELDRSKLKGLKIYIDSTDKTWNQASSRIGRLKQKGVNVREPHFVDSNCEKGECQ